MPIISSELLMGVFSRRALISLLDPYAFTTSLDLFDLLGDFLDLVFLFKGFSVPWHHVSNFTLEAGVFGRVGLNPVRVFNVEVQKNSSYVGSSVLSVVLVGF